MAYKPSLADNDRAEMETPLMSAAATSPVMLSLIGIGGRRMGMSGYGCQVANMLPLGAPVGGRPCRQGLGGKDDQPMSKLNRAELDRRGVGAGCQQGPAGSGPRMPYYMPPVHCPDSPYGVGATAWKPGRPAKAGTWVARIAQARAGGSLPVRAPQRVARGRFKDVICAIAPGAKICEGPSEPPCPPGHEPCGLKPGGDVRCCGTGIQRGPTLAWGPSAPAGGVDPWADCWYTCQQTSNPDLCVEEVCNKRFSAGGSSASGCGPHERWCSALGGGCVDKDLACPGEGSALAWKAGRPAKKGTWVAQIAQVRAGGGLGRGGIGKSYAKRLFGDGLSVDVQNHGNGHYSATVNAQGGSYAHKVFGNHFQADVARSGNGYRAAVSTHSPQGVRGVGLKKPISGVHAAAMARGVGGCGSGQRGRSAPFRNPTGVQYGVGGAVGAQPGMAYGVHDDTQQAGVFGPIVGRWPGMAVVGR